jgi:hypothetical protein
MSTRGRSVRIDQPGHETTSPCPASLGHARTHTSRSPAPTGRPDRAPDGPRRGGCDAADPRRPTRTPRGAGGVDLATTRRLRAWGLGTIDGDRLRWSSAPNRRIAGEQRPGHRTPSLGATGSCHYGPPSSRRLDSGHATATPPPRFPDPIDAGTHRMRTECGFRPARFARRQRPARSSVGEPQRAAVGRQPDIRRLELR